MRKGPEMKIACLGSTVLAVTGLTRQHLGICRHRHLDSLQTTEDSTILNSTAQFLTRSLSDITISPKWSGYLGLPVIQTRTQPPTAAALPQTERVAHAAGKAVIIFSPALTRTISWTLLKMIRRRDRSARARSRSLRRHVHRVGYV